MNVAFLFPGTNPHEALTNWVRTLSRYCHGHKVSPASCPGDCRGADVVLVLTENNSYPRPRVDQAVKSLEMMGKPFGVVHNHDNPPGVSPGNYPSFAWTRQAFSRLEGYHPILLRQPLMPPLVPFDRSLPVTVATFGHVEPKKKTYDMAKWAKREGVSFYACGPGVLAGLYAEYLTALRHIDCPVVLYDWADRVEELAPLFRRVSHFLFVLPPGKSGSGGSPTSPRYAGFFNRPVIVVDDEDTFEQDGFHVFGSLGEIHRETLGAMGPPKYGWGPDEYVDALVEHTTRFWDGCLP